MSNPFSDPGQATNTTPVHKFPLPPETRDYRPQYNHLRQYLLPDVEGTGADKGYTRVTTGAKTLDDTAGLERWKLRSVVRGLKDNPHLLEDIDLYQDPWEVNKDLERAADKAHEAADAPDDGGGEDCGDEREPTIAEEPERDPGKRERGAEAGQVEAEAASEVSACHRSRSPLRRSRPALARLPARRARSSSEANAEAVVTVSAYRPELKRTESASQKTASQTTVEKCDRIGSRRFVCMVDSILLCLWFMTDLLGGRDWIHYAGQAPASRILSQARLVRASEAVDSGSVPSVSLTLQPRRGRHV